jgi:hypothetical protein
LWQSDQKIFRDMIESKNQIYWDEIGCIINGRVHQTLEQSIDIATFSWEINDLHRASIWGHNMIEGEL